MEIPDSQIAEIFLGVSSIIGTILIFLIKSLVLELRQLHASLDKVERHLYEAKEDLFKVATIVWTCKNCPHPDMNGLLKPKTETEEKEDE